MKINALYPFLIILSLGITHSFSQSVKVDTILDYKIVDQAIQAKVPQYGADQVLVVLDIDNTILTSDTDLGSDIWYQWQTDKLDLKPLPDQKLDRDCLFNEAICLLYELGTMSLTDSLLPGYVKSWQNAGLTVFALTSRSPRCRASTERDLEQNDINLSVSPLRTVDGLEIHFDKPADSNLSYHEGVFMTQGANKGTMLADILQRSGRTFKAIIFVDDTWKNIANIQGNAANCGAGDIILFYYTKIETERLKKNNNKILTPKQAKKMDRDWDKLIRRLIKIFPERLEKSECL